LRENRANEAVSVNFSTGSKITVMAGMLAYMATGATPYYAMVEEYPGETVSVGYRDTREFPAYPVGLPDRQYLEVLQYLDEHGSASKKELIEFTRELLLLSGYTRQQERNEYAPLNTEVIDPLRDRGLVREQPIGAERRLKLTEAGEDMLKLAAYLLD
jgi:hypothetical protein